MLAGHFRLSKPVRLEQWPEFVAIFAREQSRDLRSAGVTCELSDVTQSPLTGNLFCIPLAQPPNSEYAQMIDIEAAMYRDRTIMISKYIDEQYANSLIAIILYLRSQSLRDPISLYFNCPGVNLRSGLALVRTNCPSAAL
jgi:Clp protease